MTSTAFTACWYSVGRVSGRFSGVPYNDKRTGVEQQTMFAI